MATNVYFNNYGNNTEQRLVEDLIVESIKIMGTDVFYLPNDNDIARDLLYGEDPLKKFSSAFPVEIYPNNVLDYGGDKELFSKFGLEIKNQITVILSKRSFSQRVPQNTFTRPREGDLIYVPFLNGTGELYEIKFTNQNKDFFTLGRKIPYFYELEMEKFKYSQEIIDTGINNIDEVVTNSAYSIDLNINTSSGSGTYKLKEIVFQSYDETYANAAISATVQAWTPMTGILTVTNIMGEFVDNQSVIGSFSGANYMLSSYDEQNPIVKNEPYDNKIIENESVDYVDNTDSNPFGSL